jgi:hypothetical protein
MNDNDEAAGEQLEIYEWLAGEPRPGSEERASDRIVDIVALPPGGQIPQRHDILLLANVVGDDIEHKRYVVLERELMWRLRTEKTPSDVARPFSKAWLFVREVVDYSAPVVPREEG